MLKAEMMKNKPQVPAFYEQPLKSSLSPHYKLANDLGKTLNDMSDYNMTRTALVNAKIELNQLLGESQRRIDLGVPRRSSHSNGRKERRKIRVTNSRRGTAGINQRQQ